MKSLEPSRVRARVRVRDTREVLGLEDERAHLGVALGLGLGLGLGLRVRGRARVKG